MINVVEKNHTMHLTRYFKTLALLRHSIPTSVMRNMCVYGFSNYKQTTFLKGQTICQA